VAYLKHPVEPFRVHETNTKAPSHVRHRLPNATAAYARR
jgi:hypothetical protein